MATKLTLRLDEALIEKAKRYAKSRNTSVSQLVADYLRLLEEQAAPEARPGPLTAALRGMLRGEAVDEADYLRHLETKHR